MLYIWLLDAKRTIYRSRQHVKVDRDPDLRWSLSIAKSFFGARVDSIGIHAAEEPTLDKEIFAGAASRVFSENLLSQSPEQRRKSVKHPR